MSDWPSKNKSSKNTNNLKWVSDLNKRMWVSPALLRFLNCHDKKPTSFFEKWSTLKSKFSRMKFKN